MGAPGEDGPQAWGRTLRRLTRTLQQRDLLALPVVTTAVLFMAFDPFLSPLGLMVEVALAAGALMAVRRPGLGGVLAGAALTVMALSWPGEPRLSMALCLFPLLTAASRGRLALVGGLTIWYVLACTVLEVGAGARWLLTFSAASGWFYLVLITWAIGHGVHQFGVRQARAMARLEREARRQRQQVAVDLHDTVARELVRVVIMADDSLSRALGQGEALKSIQQMAAHTRVAMEELRTMMHLLHEDGHPEPLALSRPSLEHTLADRTEALRQAGFSVSLFVGVDADELPPSIRDVVSQLVVEATVNMVRHGAPGDCSIMIAEASTQLELVFINVVGSKPFPHSTKVGLHNFRQLAEALGGSLEARSIPPHWVLEVTLPLNLPPRYSTRYAHV